MNNLTFKTDQKSKMIQWRISHISLPEKGIQNGKRYEHIIPKRIWEENLWEDIRVDSSLPEYLTTNTIQPHTGKHNLLSSWVNCANLYFPIRKNNSLQKIMLRFLQQHVSDQITELLGVELEFSFEQGSDLHPSALLGEMDGGRGTGQTSPDVAFLVKTMDGKGIVLTESKYTEHSFYSCSARTIDKKRKRINNPDPKRCMCKVAHSDYSHVCHQTIWGRKYIQLVKYSEFGQTSLKRCPAATAGYQLLRQQALAEGMAQKSEEFSLVASTVAFDDRNTALKDCLRTTGIDDFQSGWGKLFDGKAIFKTWTHQQWVQFVRDNQKDGEFNSWLEYLSERYGY